MIPTLPTGKCMAEKVPKMFGLYQDILLEENFTVHQIKSLRILRKILVDLRTDVTENGSRYALTRVKARYSLVSYLNELSDGVSEIQSEEILLGLEKMDWLMLLVRIDKMISRIFGGGGG